LTIQFCILLVWDIGHARDSYLDKYCHKDESIITVTKTLVYEVQNTYHKIAKNWQL
jgi:hypothetical protein